MRAGRIGLILSLTSLNLLQLSAPAANAANVTYTASFTQGSGASVTAMNDWETFRSQLTGSYNSFTWSSTNGNSISVTDSTGVQTLADALRTATTTSVTIGGNTWFVGTGCGAVSGYGVAVEFSNYASCNASSTFALRPLIGTSNSNWGGTNEYTINAPSQTITLTFFENAPSPTTFSTSQTSPTNLSTGSTLTYSLVMSQSVTGMAANDFQYGGTSSCNTPIVTGSGTSYSVTLTNCSEGTLILQLKANSVTGSTTTGPGSVASANTILIDRTAPTISSVTPPSSQTYVPGNSISFTLNMSETVTVTGTPRLALTIGSTTRYANYASGSNSRALVFTYVAQTSLSDIDIDGIAISNTLDLNSGSIRDLATNALSALTFTAPSLTSVLVAQPAAAPTIDSITATNGQLAIYFTPGAARGSTTSTYQYSANGGAWTNRPTGTTASPLTITGLTNGTSYTVRLRATTNAGAGDSSTAVTETPTSISVLGDSTLTLTYGSSASTGAYSATGGTNTYSWSLGSSLTGVTLSGTTVSASSATPSGIYTQTVRATDGNNQVGSKTLTITVNKATTSITIALPNSSNTAALGGAVTITATVPRAGSVNFMLGGTTISGCGSAAAASTTATCSWTPNALGSVSLTATFTPTDSANFETSTTTTLSITVVNGVSTVTLSLTGGTTTPPKGQTINIIAAVDQAGRITFMIDGKRIPGCNNKVAIVGNVTCSWKPAIQKQSTITARLVPTNNVYNPSTSSLNVRVIKRTGTR